MNMTTDEKIQSDTVSGRHGNRSARQILERLVRSLKRIRRLGSQLIFHWMDASYDLYRYLRYSNSALYSSDDRQKLEPLLFFYYHKIEKALALPTVKPVFGLDYIETTLDLAEKWAQLTGDLEAVVFRGAHAALKSYQEHVAQSLSQARPGLARRLDQFLTKYPLPNLNSRDGGTIPISLEELQTTCQSIDFERFICQRHSVRNFAERHIPSDTIKHAVNLAQHSPSVCNRQCWRVHVFTSSSDMARVLKHQNGNEGFGHLADRVLLLTADLRNFFTSGERHQASIDSGMFAMTLILAFESLGIASCCLNLCLSSREEIALRRTCRISRWETPIMMIAIGYPPEDLKVTVSARKPTDSMLYFRDLNQESSRTLGALSLHQITEGKSFKHNNIILAGNGSYSNRGCEAILRGTTQLMQDELGECRFISNYFPSEGCLDAKLEIDSSIIHRPFPLLKRYSLPWIEEQITRKVFHQPHNIAQISKAFRRSLREAQTVLMLGGDNFSLDYADTDVHFRLCQMAVEVDVPVVIWGASVGPFSTRPLFEQWAAKELRQVTLICARETATLEYLDDIGVSKNVILSADPAFYLQPTACELPEDVERTLAEGCIGLNLSPLLRQFLKIPTAESSFSAWKKVAAEIVQTLASYFPLPVLLIPHVTAETGDANRDDHIFMNQVIKLLEDTGRVLTLGPNLNASQTKWVISRVRAFAGARTHSTLAAISSCVPTICIGYSMKARGIAQDVYGHLDWLVSGQDLVKDPSVLRDRFASLLSQETAIRMQLEQVNPIMRQRARTAAEHVADIVASRRVDVL